MVTVILIWWLDKVGVRALVQNVAGIGVVTLNIRAKTRYSHGSLRLPVRCEIAPQYVRRSRLVACFVSFDLVVRLNAEVKA